MKRSIYLDNAATTFPKPRSVIKAVKECLSSYCANPGRSTHRMALLCAEKMYETRERVSEFLCMNAPEKIIFTPNATHALNMSIKGLIRARCHVITSDVEHNSVIRPLHTVSKKLGVEISRFDTDKPLEAAISPLIRNDTAFIVASAASNVTGKALDLAALSRIAKKYSLITILDASQYLGHLQLNLQSTPFDVVCAPGHKGLLGIQGGGIMAINSDVNIKTLLEGGSGGDTFNTEMPQYLPERYEAGTQCLPAIVGLGAGIEHLQSLGMDYVSSRMTSLTSLLEEYLIEAGAVIYGCYNGIASFEIPGISSNDLASRLDDDGIAVRSGLHCAPLTHKKLGTDDRGLVRASISIFNTEKDLYKLYKSLKRH